MPRILIIEDEPAMRTALSDVLIAHGHEVRVAADGAAGLRMAREQVHDLLLLDVMMPKLDGLSVCTALRRDGCQTPVLMLTARGRVEDRVNGLDSGADDYLVKPFSSRELLARVRALLRRVERRGVEPETLRLGDVVVDFTAQTATKAGKPLPLSTKEPANPPPAGPRGRAHRHAGAVPRCRVGRERLPHHAHSG
ncbi:MAG: response regulator transcription factor [Verrucomicrobiaceae bacterium]|nr:response regulator transcription factor [Verrucomicrobiaceae bacterium]